MYVAYIKYSTLLTGHICPMFGARLRCTCTVFMHRLETGLQLVSRYMYSPSVSSGLVLNSMKTCAIICPRMYGVY